MNDILDKIAVDAAAIDARLRLVNDNPECFLCGHCVRPEVCCTVEGDAFHGLKAHANCIDEVCASDPTPPAALYTRARRAVFAAFMGRREKVMPGRDIVHGGFE